MGVTIAQVAQELGKSKGTVRNALRDLGLMGTEHVVRSGDGRNTLMLDPHATALLADRFGPRPTEAEEPRAGAAEGTGVTEALREHIADLRAAVEAERAARLASEERAAAEVAELRAELERVRAERDAAIMSERRAADRLAVVAGAGLWQRLTGFRGLLGDGSVDR